MKNLSQLCLRLINFFKLQTSGKSFLTLLILIILLNISQTFPQKTYSLSSDENFNRVTILSGIKTERVVPVISPGETLAPSHNNIIQDNPDLTNWTPIQTVPGVVTAVSFVNPNVGYMSAELGVVYKTTDGGFTWNTVLNLGFPHYWYGVHAFSEEKVIIAGFNNSTGDGILRWTIDGGTTWTDDIIIAPAPFNWLMDLGFADSLHGLAVGGVISAGKVFITINGGANAEDWAPYVADPTQGWFEGNFTMRPDGNYYITGISFCRSTDYGLTWTSSPSVDSVFDGGVSFPDNLHGWTGGGSISPTVEGWVHRTTNGGTTWSGRVLSTPYPIRVVYFFNSLIGIAQGGHGNNAVGGIWESTDGGLTWTEAINTNLEMNSIDWQPVSPDSIDIWCVGFSSDGGWHSVVYKKRTGFSVIPVELSSFTASVAENFVTLNWQTKTKTNNYGFEIERQLVNSLPGSWDKIGFVPGYGTTTEEKNYSFKDEKISTGKYLYRLKQIDFDGAFNYSNEIEVDVDLSPKEFSLKQNYPNPFNPVTKIKYSIPAKAFVTLNVYNAIGEKIAELVNNEMNAGNYEISFDGTGLSSGIYYYKITAGNFSEVKKMMLVK